MPSIGHLELFAKTNVKGARDKKRNCHGDENQVRHRFVCLGTPLLQGEGSGRNSERRLGLESKDSMSLFVVLQNIPTTPPWVIKIAPKAVKKVLRSMSPQ
jgi:hypothetical protein